MMEKRKRGKAVKRRKGPKSRGQSEEQVPQKKTGQIQEASCSSLRRRQVSRLKSAPPMFDPPGNAAEYNGSAGPRPVQTLMALSPPGFGQKVQGPTSDESHRPNLRITSTRPHCLRPHWCLIPLDSSPFSPYSKSSRILTRADNVAIGSLFVPKNAARGRWREGVF